MEMKRTFSVYKFTRITNATQVRALPTFANTLELPYDYDHVRRTDVKSNQDLPSNLRPEAKVSMVQWTTGDANQ